MPWGQGNFAPKKMCIRDRTYLPPALGYLLAGGTLIAFVFFDVRHQSSLSRVLGEQVSYFKRFGRYAGYLLVGAAFVVVMNSYEGIPIAVFVLLLLAGALTFVLAKTRFGRKVYAVGGNPRAALMSGINNAAAVSYTHLDVYKRQPAKGESSRGGALPSPRNRESSSPP